MNQDFTVQKKASSEWKKKIRASWKFPTPPPPHHFSNGSSLNCLLPSRSFVFKQHSSLSRPLRDDKKNGCEADFSYGSIIIWSKRVKHLANLSKPLVIIIAKRSHLSDNNFNDRTIPFLYFWSCLWLSQFQACSARPPPPPQAFVGHCHLVGPGGRVRKPLPEGGAFVNSSRSRW